MLSANIGYVFAFTAGYFDEYETIPKLFLIAPAVYLASMFYVKETPIQLIRMNQTAVSDVNYLPTSKYNLYQLFIVT